MLVECMQNNMEAKVLKRSWMKILERRPSLVYLESLIQMILFCTSYIEKSKNTILLEKWFPLWGEQAHSLKLFCMYDKRFEI